MKRYIKLNGKTYPFKLTTAAVMQAVRDEGRNIQDISAIADIRSWPVERQTRVVYYAIKNACEDENKEFDLTPEFIFRMYFDDEAFRADIDRAAEDAQPQAVKKKVGKKAGSRR